jgi:hypothetical protein
VARTQVALSSGLVPDGAVHLSKGRSINRVVLFLFAVLVLIAAPAHAARISTNDVEGITVITIEGDIQADDDDAFSKAITGRNKVIVNLHSQGGQTFVAINIGKMIRARGFATIVAEGSVCLSACAMIWLGGEMRFLHSSALLGFHASYREDRGVKQESGAGNALVGAYYNSLGLSDEAILFLTLAPPDDMLVVDAEIASTLGIEIQPLEGDTPKRSSSELVMLQRIDLYGFDYRRIDDTNLESCRLRCEGEGRCVAFTFNRRHSVCFLKSNGRIGLHNGDAVSGYKQRIKAQLYLSNMEVLEGADMPGGDYRDFKGSFARCFVECAKDDRCLAFSWVRTNNSCWLKSSTSRLRPDKRIVSGNKVGVGRAASD